MAMPIFSNRKRAFHLGAFPLERLQRRAQLPALSDVPPMPEIDFDRPDERSSLVNAMGEYQAMLDAICDGFINKEPAQCPEDLDERARHIKSFAYFQDAPMVGIGPYNATMLLPSPRRNPQIQRLADALKNQQTKTLASGIDVIMADLKESMQAPPRDIGAHSHTVVFLYDFPRDPAADEPGYEWIADAQRHRATLLSAETAVVVAGYLRVLGFDAKAHSGSNSDVDLNKLAVAAGLATVEQGKLVNPFVGERFALAAVTTNFSMRIDQPLAAAAEQPSNLTTSLAWKLGLGSKKSAQTRDPYAQRRYVDGLYPFEQLKRVDKPTTFIDEARVARVPKRTDMFARSQFGDMGKANQEAATGGYFAQKSPISRAIRRPLGALVLLQDGASAASVAPSARKARRNAQNIKAACYFLGADAVGLSRCPEWAWYSHDATGEPIVPTQNNAISIIIDQGFDTTEGSSGDDWIAVGQSMRAYLRFSLLGGVIAKHIRNLGYSAKAHTSMDGEVLQPPLLLLSGLGEVSRIGEVIVNPFIGPRLKSGCITTDMPMTHDQPIDFGMQAFCEACNKCARECPSGAITAGPKLMFNGYEIWKSDSQKCTTYRITQKGGAMCGRCMKTCPWNREGLQHERALRWMARYTPSMAGLLAKTDDWLGNGRINPQKRWWWDLKINERGGYDLIDDAVEPGNYRQLQTDLALRYEDQTLAVYPANLAPHPWPFPFPMDRELGIEAYQAMITADEYQRRLEAGDTQDLAHQYTVSGDAPVIRVQVSRVQHMSERVSQFELTALDGSALPAWRAGAHIDVVVAPEYLRQYSLTGDPSVSNVYQIGVLREEEGRGGSKFLHRIFSEGRKVFISKPINHFPLVDRARKHFLMGGGIGITPMIAFAHECFANNWDFVLHYSASQKDEAAYLDVLANVPWAERVHLHFSDRGTRADFAQIFANYEDGWHVYTCGPTAYMDAVLSSAQSRGVPEEACHLEYFSVPELPEYVNHDFTLKLTRTGRQLQVPADKAATEVLLEHGVKVDVKCADGLCGVCQCRLVSGEVEHRDFILSAQKRQDTMILCQSRAKYPGAVVEIDL